MIVFAGAVLGAVWGALLARRRKGNRMDAAQYAGAFAILGALAGLFATIILGRMM